MKIKEIRAISITQPWAECMMSLGKNIENRTWNTHRRGYVAIHASSSYKRERFDRCEQTYGVEFDPDELDYGSIIGFAKLVDVKKEDGEYGFVFKDVIKLKQPVEKKGMLGFWKLEGKELAKCLTQLNQSQLNKLSNNS